MNKNVKISKPTETLKQSTSMYFAPQVTHFWQSQAAIMRESERVARRWFNRRHDAVNAVLEDVCDQNASQDALTAWPMKSIEILSDDISDWLALCAICAQTMAKGEIEAETEIFESTDKKRDPRKLPTRIPV